MKKTFLILFVLFLGANLFAAGKMDASVVSDKDIARVEKICEALEPVFAIETALKTFPKESYPIGDYLEVQRMKINNIFNEYGVEFNQYTDYEGLQPKAQVVFAKLKSRYSYLDSLEFKSPDELRATLKLLKE